MLHHFVFHSEISWLEGLICKVRRLEAKHAMLGGSRLDGSTYRILGYHTHKQSSQARVPFAELCSWNQVSRSFFTFLFRPTHFLSCSKFTVLYSSFVERIFFFLLTIPSSSFLVPNCSIILSHVPKSSFPIPQFHVC